MRHVNRDQSLDAAFEHQLRITFEQVLAMMMTGDEVEVTFLEQVFLNPTQHLRRIAAAQLRNQHAQRECALRPQRTRDVVRLVIEFPGRLKDAIFRLLGNGIGRLRLIQNQREGSR